ncbi:general stress protein [Pseudomonas sp. NA-150]|uniref:general stress protein n=1 Tax=Pseudomonas sp. NA-150 TaxID=3367525 RepID=UPI0037C7454D
MPTTKKPMTGGKQSDTGKKGTGAGGNMVSDREKASDTGKKGGDHSHTGGRK